jgi:hypothetical protein
VPAQLSPLGSFLRLWFVMFFSYLLLRFAFNLGVMGWIDLRREFLLEILLIPFGQAVVLWLIAKRLSPRDSASQTTA